MKRKLLTLFLALAMVLTMMPAMAFTAFASSGDLPSGYTKVDYIESHGQEWIDTEYSNKNATSSVKVDVKYAFTKAVKDEPDPAQENYTMTLFGAIYQEGSTVSNRTGFISARKEETKTIVGTGSTAGSTATKLWETVADKVETVSIDMNVASATQKFTVTHNGTALAEQAVSGTVKCNSTWHVFAVKGLPEVRECSYAKIYSLKITEDGTVKRNFIPCKNNTTGKYGLYDTVTEKFYGNASGQGEITGPSVLPSGYTEVDYIESHGQEWIDTEYSNKNATSSVKVDVKYAFTKAVKDEPDPNCQGSNYTMDLYGASYQEGSPVSNRTGFISARKEETKTIVGTGSTSGGSATKLWETVADKVEIVSVDMNVASATQKFTVTHNGTALAEQTVNGTVKCNNDWYIFGINGAYNIDTTKPIYECSYAKIYSLKITEDGTVKRNFIPCKNNTTGKYGLYDTVTEKFYGNGSGKGEITGPTSPESNVSISVPSGVTLKVYQGFAESTLVSPVSNSTKDGVVTYLYNLSVGNYRYVVSGTGYYKLHKNFIVTAKKLEDGMSINADPGKKAGKYEYSESYGFTDEVMAGPYSTAALETKYPNVVTTPSFNSDKKTNEYASSQDVIDYIKSLDDANDNLYYYVAGKTCDSKDMALAVLTTTSLEGKTLKEAAEAVRANGKPTIMLHAQIHGDEPSGCEGALATIKELDSSYASALDKVNVIVMPRVNVNGADSFTRGTKQYGDLNRNNLLVTQPEIQATHNVYNAFMPEVVIDMHEYGGVDLNAGTGVLDDAGLTFSSSLNNTSALVSLTKTMAYKAMEDTAKDGIRLFEYVQAGYSDQNPLHASHYYALRGSLNFLIETPNPSKEKKTLARRTYTQYLTVRSMIDYVCNNVDTVKNTVKADRDATVAKGTTYDSNSKIVLKHSQNSTAHTYTRPTFNKATGESVNPTATDSVRYYEVDAKSRTYPTAYVVPKNVANISKILTVADYNGITYYELGSSDKVMLRQYAGNGSSASLNTAAETSFSSGAYVFPMNQSSGIILALLMEPDTYQHESSWPESLVQAGYVTASQVYRSETNLTSAGKLPLVNETLITLDKNGGAADGSAKAEYDATAVTSFNAPTRTGYALNGFFTEKTAGTKVLKADGTFAGTSVEGYIANGKWSNKTAEIKLYAQWSANETTATLDKNGGTSAGTAKIDYDSTEPTSFNAPARTGYTLLGLYTSADGGTKVLNADGTFAATSVDGYITNGKWSKDAAAITLYAHWSKTNPTIIEGDSQTIKEGTNKNVVVRSNAELEAFKEVRFDGKVLDAKNYDVTEGSTVVTLKSSFVSKLKPGTYKISVVSEGGSADTTLTVTPAPTTNTGDNNNIVLYIGVALLALLGIAVMLLRKRAYNK